MATERIHRLLSWESLPKAIQFATPGIVGEVDIKSITELIKNKTEPVNCYDPEGKDTLLHRFAENIDEQKKEHQQLLEFLIDEGAKIDALNINNETPLHIAAKKNKYRLLYYLVSRNSDPNIENNDGNTCLHLAVKNGCVEAVAVLHLFAGTKLDESKQNKLFFTPLRLAQQVEYNEKKPQMEKICDILSTQSAEDVQKVCEKHLKPSEEAGLWRLQPSIIFNTNVSGNARYVAGQFVFQGENAASTLAELAPNATLQPLLTEGPFPAVMISQTDSIIEVEQREEKGAT
eukprot:gene5593-6282_t